MRFGAFRTLVDRVGLFAVSGTTLDSVQFVDCNQRNSSGDAVLYADFQERLVVFGGPYFPPIRARRSLSFAEVSLVVTYSAAASVPALRNPRVP